MPSDSPGRGGADSRRRSDADARWLSRCSSSTAHHALRRRRRPRRRHASHIEPGEIFGLIGPNGAGKTTVLQRRSPACTGRPIGDGALRRHARSAGQKRYEITKLGIARTFQNIRLFPEMTALENVHRRRRRPPPDERAAAPCSRPARHRREEADGRDRGHASCSSSWASPTGPTTSPATCPTATSAASRSPGPWPPSPKLLLPRRAGRRLQPGREADAHGAHPRASATRATRCCSSSTT